MHYEQFAFVSAAHVFPFGTVSAYWCLQVTLTLSVQSPDVRNGMTQERAYFLLPPLARRATYQTHS
jgi:hypothetical protein